MEDSSEENSLNEEKRGKRIVVKNLRHRGDKREATHNWSHR